MKRRILPFLPYTQRNLFEILLNQTEIRLYSIRFRKDFSVYMIVTDVLFSINSNPVTLRYHRMRRSFSYSFGEN